MRAYCFDFINRDGSIDSYDIGAFASDREAERQARAALNVSMTAVAVDLWSEGVRVAHFYRDALMHRSLAKARA